MKQPSLPQASFGPIQGPDVTSEQDFSDKLALDPSKTTVIRSARTDGPDNDSDGYPDYYTWTYTVTTTP